MRGGAFLSGFRKHIDRQRTVRTSICNFLLLSSLAFSRGLVDHPSIRGPSPKAMSAHTLTSGPGPIEAPGLPDPSTSRESIDDDAQFRHNSSVPLLKNCNLPEVYQTPGGGASHHHVAYPIISVIVAPG